RSQVVDIHEGDFMDVLIPIHKSREVYFRQDSIVKLVSAKGDAIYEFKAVIQEKLFGRVPLLRVKIISEVNKIQRRDSYRLKLMRDIEARHIEDIQGKKFGEKFRCNLHDISTGGILVSTNKEFQEGDMLEVTIGLNGLYLVTYGIIVRRTLTVSHKAPYSYGIKFDKMSEFDKNKLTKFIFEEQRKLIKKGLI
ncbi:MAG TPA: PilZ domain-containing protein, partial [Clostridia bacterium]|nr:PilZ domain-containing protein [Clostridia bacterium]